MTPLPSYNDIFKQVQSGPAIKFASSLLHPFRSSVRSTASSMCRSHFARYLQRELEVTEARARSVNFSPLSSFSYPFFIPFAIAKRLRIAGTWNGTGGFNRTPWLSEVPGFSGKDTNLWKNATTFSGVAIRRMLEELYNRDCEYFSIIKYVCTNAYTNVVWFIPSSTRCLKYTVSALSFASKRPSLKLRSVILGYSIYTYCVYIREIYQIRRCRVISEHRNSCTIQMRSTLYLHVWVSRFKKKKVKNVVDKKTEKNYLARERELCTARCPFFSILDHRVSRFRYVNFRPLAARFNRRTR